MITGIDMGSGFDGDALLKEQEMLPDHCIAQQFLQDWIRLNMRLAFPGPGS